MKPTPMAVARRLQKSASSQSRAVLKGGGQALRNERSRGRSLLPGHGTFSTSKVGGWQLVAVGGWRLVGVDGWWGLTVGGGWQRLVVGRWWGLTVGSGWQRLVVGRWWGLTVGSGWQRLVVGRWWGLTVGGGWQRLVGVGRWWGLTVGGGWWLAVGGPWGLSLRAVRRKQKETGFFGTALSQSHSRTHHVKNCRRLVLGRRQQRMASRPTQTSATRGCVASRDQGVCRQSESPRHREIKM